VVGRGKVIGVAGKIVDVGMGVCERFSCWYDSEPSTGLWANPMAIANKAIIKQHAIIKSAFCKCVFSKNISSNPYITLLKEQAFRKENIGKIRFF